MKEKHVIKKKKKKKDSSSSPSSSSLSSLDSSSSDSLEEAKEERSSGSCSSSSSSFDGRRTQSKTKRRRKRMMCKQLKSAIEKGNVEKIKTLARSMYRGVTTTTTKNNNDTKKRRKQKRRDTEENAFHIIARCKESYKNPLETLKFMLEECFTQQQDEDDSLLLETLLSQKGRRKGGKRRRDGKKIKKKIPLELAAKQTVVSREPFAFQMLKKKTPPGVCAEKATRRYEKSRAREATLFEAWRKKALEEKRKSEQMKCNEKLREANEEDEGDELLYERLWQYEDEEKEEDEETRRGKYSSAATMKNNNKRSLSVDDDARKEKKKKKKKETEKGEEKHRTIPEEEERDGFKSPTERELRKRNGGSLPIATTQSYYAIWRACSKKAEKKTLRAKDLPYLHDVGDQSESSAIEWILKSSVSGPEGGCSCEAPRKSHHSKSCAVKLLRSEMLRWHPDRFVSRFRGCFFSLREEEEALVKVNATSARCVEMFRNFKTSSSST
jgi:hypothetical protein